MEALSRCLRVPFVNANCTDYTQVGYVGANVDSIVHLLFAKANRDPKLAERGKKLRLKILLYFNATFTWVELSIIFFDEVDKLRSGKCDRDVAGTGVQQGFFKVSALLFGIII